MEKKTEQVKEIKDLNIYEKMSAITNELGVVAKNLNVDMGKGKSYKAVQEKDVLDAVKPIEEKYRVYSYPKERKIIESGILEKETQYGVSKNMYLRIETTYEFVNLDKTEEKITMTSYADGIDSGDKATGKAMTYSDKYSLLKAYKIATGDDPDKEASPEKGYTKQTIETSDETKEKIRLMARFNNLVIETNTDQTLIYETYKVKNQTEMSIKQLEQAIRRMENKLEEEK